MCLLFVTPTIPNCTIEELPTVIKHLSKSYLRLLERKELKPYLLGSFRVIDLTYDERTGEVHLHLHCILALKSSYRSRGYLNQDRWLSLWQQCARSLAITQIKIKPIKPNSGTQAIAEAAGCIASYALKPLQIEDCPPEDLAALHFGLEGRKLYAFTGEFTKERWHLPVYQAPCTCKVCSAEIAEYFARWDSVAAEYVTTEASLKWSAPLSGSLVKAEGIGV